METEGFFSFSPFSFLPFSVLCKDMDKRFAGILVACVVVLGIVFVFTNKKSAAPSSGSGSKLSNHIIGENAKGVNLTEYGDFQCPYCGQYYPIVKQVVEKYKADIAFQFRHFPLSQHQNARAAARAAEAAAKQNKFWEMYDMLYQQQSSWENSQSPMTVFESYAQQLSLNMAQFKKDYASSEVNDIINADYAEGVRLGVDSTPSFFLQGKKLDPAPKDVDGFSKVIDQAIKDASKK